MSSILESLLEKKISTDQNQLQAFSGRESFMTSQQSAQLSFAINSSQFRNLMKLGRHLDFLEFSFQRLLLNFSSTNSASEELFQDTFTKSIAIGIRDTKFLLFNLWMSKKFLKRSRTIMS